MAISPRNHPVPILQGEDIARIDELLQDVDVARQAQEQATRRGTARAGDELPSVSDAEDAVRAYVREAAERAEIVVLQPIGYAHRELRAEHPPRYVRRMVAGEETDVIHEDDAELELNTATYPMAVLMFADPDDEDLRTIVEPHLSEAGLKKFLRQLPEGEFDKLWMRAYLLNKEQSADPKALISSVDRLTSGVTSGSREESD